MSQCDFCGRYASEDSNPHPKNEECPHRERHEGKLRSEKTLFAEIANTMVGDSIALKGWDARRPNYETVFETRTWRPENEDSERDERGWEYSEVDYWCKTIWTADKGDIHRIEYDPTSEKLLAWNSGYESQSSGNNFGVFIRSENSNASYYGSTLE